VFNTDRLSIDSCVQQIRALAARPEFAETEASRTMLKDMALQAHVRSALRDDRSTHSVDVTIECTSGRVALIGMVANDAERTAAVNVAAAVPGVVEVDNRLRVMNRSRLSPSAGS
jgi:osmotically-inducible protein OsmY